MDSWVRNRAGDDGCRQKQVVAPGKTRQERLRDDYETMSRGPAPNFIKYTVCYV